jgi:Methyltransferase domain
MTRDIDISSPRADAFAPTDRSDPSYPKSLVDYCFQEFLVRDGQLLQVYEELLNIAYWIRGFAPHNVLEVGTRGSTFFLLSRLATGKKVAVDICDMRAKLHHFMFGHEWCFFQGNSQAPEMQQAVSSYCDRFDLIFIDGDHRYEGVKRDFENFRPLLSKRGVILFHDVDPDHVFKGREGGDAWRFWRDLDEGSKTLLCCSRSNGAIEVMGQRCHFGGFGIWSPT